MTYGTDKTNKNERLFLVNYIEERLWLPIQTPEMDEGRNLNAKRSGRSDQNY